MVSKLRTHNRFSFSVRMKRSATPFPSGSRTKLGELSMPKKATSCWKSSAKYVANDRLRHRLIGYARVSKADGSQSLDLQRDDRPGLDSCVRALRTGDVLVVWKLDRLGRNLAHLVNTVQDLSARGVGLRVLTGQGAQIDTTTAAGRLVFGIFAALAGVRAGADPRTHPGRAHGRAGARTQRRCSTRPARGLSP